MLDSSILHISSLLKSGQLCCRWVSFVAAVFIAASSSVSSKPLSVQTSILSQTPDELTIAVEFDSLFTRVEIATAVAGGKTAIYPVLVAVPPTGEVTLRTSLFENPQSLRNSTEYLTEVSATIPSAYLDEIFSVRGQRMARVIVSPYQSGQWYRTVRFTLSFSVERATASINRSSEGKQFSRLFASALPNAEMFDRLSEQAQSSTASAAALHPFDQNQVWTKISISNTTAALQTDLYRVTGAQLVQAGYTLPLPTSQIRLFYSGGLPIEVDNNRPRPDFREVAIKVVDGNDGQFSAADYFLFAGEKVDRWIYPSGFPPRFVNNIYTNTNVYWMGVSPNFEGTPQRISSVSVTPNVTIDTAFTSVVARVRAEQDNLISEDINGHIEDYFNWHWTNASSLAVSFATPGRTLGDTAQLLLIGKTNNCCDAVSFMNASVNGLSAFSKSCNRFNCSFRTTNLVDGFNNLNLFFGRQLTSIPAYFDYAEIIYNRELRPDNNQLDLVFPLSSRIARLNVADQFSATPLIIDVTDPCAPVELTGATRASGLVSADFPLSPVVQKRLLYTTDAKIQSPSSLQLFTLNNLRGQRPQADLIIVAPRAFLGAMQEYATYRQQEGYSMVMTPVEEIMDNFAYGMYDPIAIRDYLKFAYESFDAPAPSTALFVGDGNFDFLDRFATGQPNYVPVSIQGRSRSYSDDNFVYFGDYGLYVGDTAGYVDGQGPDMVVGRWPVKSTSEIRTIISKTKRYEAATNVGEWRNRITLVADDQFSSDSDNETFHAVQTEQLEKQFIPSTYERKKIYAWEYPFVNREKPNCNDDIVAAFNEGSLIVNYVGHGNPDVWAHERTFKRTTDLSRLTNRDRLPLVFAASCAIGFFDDPNRQGMGEDLLTMSNGGAIGVVAASRLVYAFDNSEFNKKSFEVMFDHPELTIAEQFYLSKLLRQYRNGRFIAITNDQQYIYFGDPLLRLGQPVDQATVDLNPSTLTALARTTVSGTLTDSNGVKLSGSGEVSVSLLDADRAKVFKLLADSGGTVLQQITYLVNGPSLFKGTVATTDGNYALTFVPPADLSFGEQAARVVTYATIGGRQAVGLLDSIFIADTVATNTDSTGPMVLFGIAGRESFAAGDQVLETDTLVITAIDSLGINLSGSIGHTIDVVIDGNEFQRQNLTRDFSYLSGSYTTGTVRVPLSNLSDGEHTISVRVWDNANNSGSGTTSVKIVAPTSAASSEMLPYPNPMMDETTFYFTLVTPVDALSLDIYTLAGRKIRSLRATNLSADSYPNSQLTLSWDGRDFAGDRVASGVYLYRSQTSTSAGNGSEQFGKIVVVKQ